MEKEKCKSLTKKKKIAKKTYTKKDYLHNILQLRASVNEELHLPSVERKLNLLNMHETVKANTL